jgi:hypothetical protein
MDNETEEILHEHANDINVEKELHVAEAEHGIIVGDVNTYSDHKDPGHDGKHHYGEEK